MSDFEPPRVDGLLEPLPMVSIEEILRLDRFGYSASVIAATLKLSVLDVEQSLSKLALLRALSGHMRR